MASVILNSIGLLAFVLASNSCSELLSRQKRAWIIDSFSIAEEHPGPFPYEMGKILLERAYLVTFKLYGPGVDMDPKGLFSMDPETGMVFVHRAIDYEQHQSLMLRFEAIRKSNSQLDTKLGIEVNVLDINDHSPIFQRDVYEVTVGESNRQGSYITAVMAFDEDMIGSSNSTFHYEITSVRPNTPNTEFFIDSHGAISFKGCLDYQTAEKYTLIVEAKDHGEVVSLSSSTTVILHIADENNHLPYITGHTGSGRVLEGETGASLLRIHASDMDTRTTPAWRVKYSIEGEEGANFNIVTEPETNDGILTVVKALDYEDGAERQLTVTVQNEEPYFSCEVKQKTASGLWVVDTIGGRSHVMLVANNAKTGDVPKPNSKTFTIQVEDANDPPVFLDSVKDVLVKENLEIGHPLETLTAVDPDSSHSNTFQYVKGNDPDRWVSVDPRTGLVTTAKRLDRESPFLVNNVYTVIVFAVENGESPLTGTMTLRIHVLDENDNIPQLSKRHLDMCTSEVPTRANITVFDLDQEPYGGPFQFELLGNVLGKWRLDLTYGFTVILVKESTVYAGTYSIQLRISDMQGQFSLCNMSVSVCDCELIPNCHQKAAIIQMDYKTTCIIFSSLLVLLFFLLLGIDVSWGVEMSSTYVHHSSGALLHSNTEKPGTDCEVPNTLTRKHDENLNNSLHLYQTDGQFQSNRTKVLQRIINVDVVDQGEQHLNLISNSSLNYKTIASNSFSMTRSVCRGATRDSSLEFETALFNLLHQRLVSIETPDLELGDYDAVVYNEEGGSDSAPEPDLDAISISDKTFDLRALDNLGPSFNELASVCTPGYAKN